METAFIGLGGNIGDVPATFAAALTEFLADGRSTWLAGSSLYRSPPWGGVAQADYWNAVACIRTQHSARSLLNRCLDIEAMFGRDRNNEVRWGARTLDLDVLLFGEEAIATPALTLPHPRLLDRAFVVLPMLEISPELHLPDGTRLSDAARAHAGAIITRLDQPLVPGDLR